MMLSETLYHVSLAISLKPRPMQLVSCYECCSLELHSFCFLFSFHMFSQQSVVVFSKYIQNLKKIISPALL